MGKIYPDNLNPIDTKDVEGALRQLEEYIRYITERTEFYIGTSEKIVARFSAAEYTERLAKIEKKVTINEQSIASMNGTLSSLRNTVDLFGSSGSGAPDSTTPGVTGSIYVDTSQTPNEVYVCTNDIEPFVWIKLVEE